MKGTFIYEFCKGTCYWFFKLGWRLESYGLENIPESGGFIIAANHRSYADPPLVGVSISRPIHFLAKKQLFNFKPFGWLITNLNSHPLNREGGGREALRQAKKLLLEGYPITLFPEGGRSKTDEFLPPKAGVGLLAIQSQCPVVPCYIHNSGHMPKFKKLTVTFGAPIDPKPFTSYEELSKHVMNEIAKIKEQVLAKANFKS